MLAGGLGVQWLLHSESAAVATPGQAGSCCCVVSGPEKADRPTGGVWMLLVLVLLLVAEDVPGYGSCTAPPGWMALIAGSGISMLVLRRPYRDVMALPEAPSSPPVAMLDVEGMKGSPCMPPQLLMLSGPAAAAMLLPPVACWLFGMS